MVSVQAQLAIEEAVALVAFDVGGALAFVRFSVIVTAFLEASPAMIGFDVRASMLSQLIVALEAMRAEIVVASQCVIMVILVQ